MAIMHRHRIIIELDVPAHMSPNTFKQQLAIAAIALEQRVHVDAELVFLATEPVRPAEDEVIRDDRSRTFGEVPRANDCPAKQSGRGYCPGNRGDW